MSDRDVEAVFVIYYGETAHKAAYGRDVDGNSYTKDFFQLSQSPELREALLKMFPPAAANDNSAPITYRWPGGSAQGQVTYKSSDRPHFAWFKTDGAPAPLKMSPAPTASGPQTIPGDPTKTTEADANAQYTAFTATGMSAYLVAIKLADEPAILHLRVYLSAPTVGLEFADIAQLPTPIRELALSATATRAFKWLALTNEGQKLTPDVAGLIAKLEENPNVLLVGPPGTGKTVLLDRLAQYVEDPGNRVYFDPDKNHDAWSVEKATAAAGKVRTVVFHPNYAYDNLVVGLLPTPTSSGGIGVRAVAGPLLNLAYYATENPASRAVLVLDEFNRGNAASILGDILALMDKDKRGSATIDLAYAELGIDVAPDFTSANSSTIPTRFTLPHNLWLVAAMNSSDRSVAPLDAALRRRFSMLEVPPDYEALEVQLGAADNLPSLSGATSVDDAGVPAAESSADPLAQWESAHIARLAVEVLKAVNRRISSVLGHDFELGQSNFWHVIEDGFATQNALDALVTAWDDRVRPTLRLAFQDNDEALAAVLLAGSADNAGSEEGVAHAAWWRAGESSVGIYGQPRLVLARLGDLDPSAALAELLRQVNT
ncbi:McrB family protein [Mycobacteroides abscessus]|uniref:McrB family protein n=2 Tax=Mycobacteroides abscessus TaxID=36809 RepID=UPI0002DA5977|nr:AAA family ATPase [Mycobacteroides abscessus]RRE00747.1 hypothetical protein D9R13_21220 [Mycobacteroides abscessus subsp. massiliense]